MRVGDKVRVTYVGDRYYGYSGSVEVVETVANGTFCRILTDEGFLFWIDESALSCVTDSPAVTSLTATCPCCGDPFPYPLPAPCPCRACAQDPARRAGTEWFDDDRTREARAAAGL